MKFKVELDRSEIRDAIKAYVEQQIGKKVTPNGVSISYTKAQDQRDTDQMSATVTCEST